MLRYEFRVVVVVLIAIGGKSWASLAEETDSKRIELILSACNADVNIGKSDCALDDRLPLDNFEKGSNS